MNFRRTRFELLLPVVAVIMLLLSACGGRSLSTATPTVAPTGTSIPTAVPQKTLVVCIGEEPTSLYLYKNSSRAMWSVLEALYDGPIDTVNYEPSPVILNQLPTLENGAVRLESVAVTEGDEVSNTEGDIVALRKGVRVFPEGCTSPECAVTWDGVSPLRLVQMVVKFDLLGGVTWSDGTPLTAGDSVFSYTVSTDPATVVSKTNIKRTASYLALDDQTIEWKGKPGYLTLNPSAFFWIPLPAHQLNELTAEELNTAELTNSYPLGWGAYKIDEWVQGDHIRLVKNPNYYRAAEGLPKFDVVVYRFLSGFPEKDISPVVTGECDVIDTSAGLETQIINIRELELAGKIKAYFSDGPEWEALNFGIKPASYDDVYNPYLDRPDYFGDLRVRQAVAYCVDREKINQKVLFSQSTLPQTYLPPNHPYAANGLVTYSHDSALGIKLLEEVGWTDPDGDPMTPRVAQGVEGVLNGTELTLKYYVTESELHAATANIVAESLAECGVRVEVSYNSADDMYRSGESGIIFGRNFDLSEIAWSTGRQPPCFLYATSEIPTAKNKWLGTRYGGVNITGYSNLEYDAACAEAMSAGMNRDLFKSRHQRLQEILAEEIPVLPLFYHVKVMVTRTDLCGVSLDVTSRSPLKNIESFDISDPCLAD